MRSRLRQTALGVFLLPLLVFGLSGAGAAHAAAGRTLPIRLCLTQPKDVQVNGQDVLRCDRPATTLPKRRDFYLLVSVADPNGFQTYGLDWSVQRWQAAKKRWATVRQQMGDRIQPSWQYVWLLQTGLAAGRYRAVVSSDFLAKLVDAPMFRFAVSFTVR